MASPPQAVLLVITSVEQQACWDPKPITGAFLEAKREKKSPGQKHRLLELEMRLNWVKTTEISCAFRGEVAILRFFVVEGAIGVFGCIRVLAAVKETHLKSQAQLVEHRKTMGSTD